MSARHDLILMAISTAQQTFCPLYCGWGVASWPLCYLKLLL